MLLAYEAEILPEHAYGLVTYKFFDELEFEKCMIASGFCRSSYNFTLEYGSKK